MENFSNSSATVNYEELFWSKVQITETCWPWIAYRNPAGYGHFAFGGKIYKAHRIAFLLTHGRLNPNLFILHKCANPSCCNPENLFEGTAQDNMDDKVQKGRAPRGEQGKHKLTSKDVLLIRKMASTNKYSYTSLGRMFNCSKTLIRKIVLNQLWRHLV